MNWIKRLFGAKPGADADDRSRFFTAMENAAVPWAMFEIKDIPEDGRIQVEFNWNQPFIKRINELGFQAENEQDTVQLFFYASQMKPQELADQGGDDDAAQSVMHPSLTTPTNRVAR